MILKEWFVGLKKHFIIDTKKEMICFHIREVEIKDNESIFRLLKEFAGFQKTPEKLSITVEQMKEDKDLFHGFVAETTEYFFAGFITYFPAYYSWLGKAIYVDDLYVTESYRNQGIGKALLQSVINKAKENDCKKVRWQVSQWNVDAIGFYKSMGAIIDNTECNCDLVL